MMTASATRQQIKDTFAGQLAAGGYLSASLDLVARQTGIKKPSVYHHFPGGKQALLAEVGNDYIATQHAKITAAMAAEGDLATRLTALSVAVVDPTGVLAGFDDRLFDALSHIDDETRTAISHAYVTELLDPVEALFRDELTSGELVGSPSDSALLTNAFLHMARGITFRPDDPDLPRQLVTLFCDGARRRPQ
ncbi:MAG: TetR/AcrR family transcriptional regulator [Micrococcales bacterium]|nr:TetR/AcrR family transcriptional regulator [Micrococcales bacterium]